MCKFFFFENILNAEKIKRTLIENIFNPLFVTRIGLSFVAELRVIDVQNVE